MISSQSSKNTHDSLLAVKRAVAGKLGHSTGHCFVRRASRRLCKSDKADTETEKLKKMMAKIHKPSGSEDYHPGLL